MVLVYWSLTTVIIYCGLAYTLECRNASRLMASVRRPCVDCCSYKLIDGVHCFVCVKDVHDEHEGSRTERTSLRQVLAQTSQANQPLRRSVAEISPTIAINLYSKHLNHPFSQFIRCNLSGRFDHAYALNSVKLPVLLDSFSL